MFKQKIKVYRHYSGNNRQVLPEISEKGDWVDLSVLEDTHIKDSSGLIPLGVSMKLPKGMEAIVVPRSSTFKHFGLMQTNSVGVIDNSYNGTHDEWKFPYFATKEVFLQPGHRICQFRIQLSQKATVWQKLKWLFSSGIEFVDSDSLSEESRGGFGTTGK